jgi:excisionase family DNA binding protein
MRRRVGSSSCRIEFLPRVLIHTRTAVDESLDSTAHGATLHAMSRPTSAAEGPRFLQLADVAEILNISAAQAYALVRSKSLPAIKVGGRGQWRIESAQLEAYIQRAYDETEQFLDQHPFGRPEDQPSADEHD